MAYGRRFREIFGVNLTQPLWDNRTGLDLGLFDETVVKSTDDESIAESIEKRWGPAARQMIETLLDIHEANEEQIDAK